MVALLGVVDGVASGGVSEHGQAAAVASATAYGDGGLRVGLDCAGGQLRLGTDVRGQQSLAAAVSVVYDGAFHGWPWALAWHEMLMSSRPPAAARHLSFVSSPYTSSRSSSTSSLRPEPMLPLPVQHALELRLRATPHLSGLTMHGGAKGLRLRVRLQSN